MKTLDFTEGFHPSVNFTEGGPASLNFTEGQPLPLTKFHCRLGLAIAYDKQDVCMYICTCVHIHCPSSGQESGRDANSHSTPCSSEAASNENDADA